MVVSSRLARRSSGSPRSTIVLWSTSRCSPLTSTSFIWARGVVLRFSAFNQRTALEIKGNITTIAANISNNPQAGEAWYSARIKFPKHELARLGDLALHAGMPVEAFIQTDERTTFSYLAKPLADQINSNAGLTVTRLWPVSVTTLARQVSSLWGVGWWERQKRTAAWL
ncbi:type I secretion membrane fusion protein, HlyD family [compost metagenome]